MQSITPGLAPPRPAPPGVCKNYTVTWSLSHCPEHEPLSSSLLSLSRQASLPGTDETGRAFPVTRSTLGLKLQSLMRSHWPPAASYR